MPTAVSLFSGCGGSDFGLKAAGFEVILANDILQYARDVYEANLSDAEFKLGDVSKITSFPKADILVGCYPCQGFSQGGVRDPSRRINYLYREFDRALRQIKPKAFIVENVSGMQRADLSHLLRNQVTRFRLAGYSVTYSILDARDYGVPQERRRLFIVGIRSDFGIRYAFPNATAGPKCPLPHIDIQTALRDLPLWPEGEFNTEPFHWYYMSRNRRRDWHETSRTVVARGRHTPLHPVSPRMVRLGPDKWKFEDDGRARRFSFRECAILQGFPRSMNFPETAGIDLRYRVIGNAVPPPLFKAVASAIPDIW